MSKEWSCLLGAIWFNPMTSRPAACVHFYFIVEEMLAGKSVCARIVETGKKVFYNCRYCVPCCRTMEQKGTISITTIISATVGNNMMHLGVSWSLVCPFWFMTGHFPCVVFEEPSPPRLNWISCWKVFLLGPVTRTCHNARNREKIWPLPLLRRKNRPNRWSTEMLFSIIQGLFLRWNK